MEQEKKIYLKGLTIAIIGIVVLSFDALLIRMSDASGVAAVFYRAFFTFISISIIFFLKNRKKSLSIIYSGGYPMIISGIMWGISGTGFTLGVHYAGAANTLVLVTLAPLFAAAFSAIFYKRKPSLVTVIAAIIALFGIWYMYREGFGDMDLLGLFYALLTPLFLGSNLAFMRKHKEMSRMSLVIIGGITGSVIALVLSKGNIAIANESILPLAILGLVVIPFSQTMISTGTRYISAADAALVNSSETVLGIFYVWLFLGEIPNKDFLIGGSLVVLAITANSVYQSHMRNRKVSPEMDSTNQVQG